MRNCFAFLLLVGVCHASPQTVYLTNQSPSHLYINTANGKAQQSNSPQEATVLIQGNASGFLKLLQTNPPVGETLITGTIHGLTPGLHGIHVHQSGNLSNGCLSTGTHYNPFQKDHGAPESRERHMGDLGNIQADNAGNAHVYITDRQITLVGPNSVLGRAIVVHDGVDDLGLGGDHGSRTTGNAGGRAGCGVIGRS